MIPKDQMTPDQLKIEKIRETWNKVRLMDAEEVKALDFEDAEEYKEAYKRFYERYHKDMDNMIMIASKLKDIMEPKRLQRKTKGQRKRDKYARVQEREAARATKK